jgi:hypothetical protein
MTSSSIRAVSCSIIVRTSVLTRQRQSHNLHRICFRMLSRYCNWLLSGSRGMLLRIHVGSTIFLPPRRTQSLWAVPSFLSNGYNGLLPQALDGRSVKLNDTPLNTSSRRSVAFSSAVITLRFKVACSKYFVHKIMPSSAMLRRVALVRTEVSEERIASIIKMKRIGELGTTLAVTTNRSTLRSTALHRAGALWLCYFGGTGVSNATRPFRIETCSTSTETRIL